MQNMAQNFYRLLERHLQSLETPIDFKELHYLSRVPQSSFWYWEEGKRFPTAGEIDKLAATKVLGLDRETLEAWLLVDKYRASSIRKAVKLLTDEKALLLIDEVDAE